MTADVFPIYENTRARDVLVYVWLRVALTLSTPLEPFVIRHEVTKRKHEATVVSRTAEQFDRPPEEWTLVHPNKCARG